MPSLLNFADWESIAIVERITVSKLLNALRISSTAFSPSLSESHSLNSPSLALSSNVVSISIILGIDICLLLVSLVIPKSSNSAFSIFLNTLTRLSFIVVVDSAILSSYALSKSSSVLKPCFSNMFIISFACRSDIWSLGILYLKSWLSNP